MVLANERAHKEATAWMKAARPRGVTRLGFAWRRFRTGFVVGLGIMGFISLVDPAAFDQTGSAPTLGWAGWLTVAVFAICLLYGWLRRDRIFDAAERIREPFARPLEDDPSFEGAYAAVAACNSPFVSRFGLGWIWAPAAAFAAGTLLAFADAYFVIDALLARFHVGWGQGLLFGVDLVIGLLCFAVAAHRLSTWRLAASVYKSVTTGYPA